MATTTQNRTPSKTTQAAQKAVGHLKATAATAAQAKVAQTAMALRSLATAAEAMRRIPGGGAVADALDRALDRAVNKGGRLYVADGKLKRKGPAPVVGIWPAVAAVAPWALRAVGPAVTAARVGLGRFGGALVANLRTGAAFAASKAGALLERAKALPGMATAAKVASAALTTAGVFLGLRQVAPETAKTVDAAAAAAVAKTRRAAGRVARGASRAAQQVADTAAAIPTALSTGVKWAAGLAIAALVLPKVL